MPEQLFPEQLFPEQPFPEQLLPEQLLPEQLLPEQLFPEQLFPDAISRLPLNWPLLIVPAGCSGSASHWASVRLFRYDGSSQARPISSGVSVLLAIAFEPSALRPHNPNKRVKKILRSLILLLLSIFFNSLSKVPHHQQYWTSFYLRG